MAADDVGLRDRYRGALLGSAIGDALGATLEFTERDAIRARYGVLRDIVGGGWLNLPAGEITDDTQMARCIARSLVELGRFDADDIAARFVAWYRSEPPDIGTTTRHALALLADGVSWREAGRRTHVELRPNDASNGSVMRCTPVALFARADAALNAACSADSSRLTHANPLCVAGCVALNAAIAALLDDPAADALARALAATNDKTLRAALAAAPNLNANALNPSGYVLDTLQVAFWGLLRHATFEDALVAVVNLGGDADTTGAVAGALAGARWGVAAIPDRWRDALLGRDELLALADGLLACAPSPPDPLSQSWARGSSD